VAVHGFLKITAVVCTDCCTS